MSASREKREEILWDEHQKADLVPLEFTEEIKPENFGLEQKEANQLLGGIDIISAELQVLKDAYVDVIELEITTENLPVFKDLRKNFTKNRTSREKLRKVKKSYFLNGGRFVDAVFKNIDAECDLMESKLLEAEKFFENQEKAKALALNEARKDRLMPYVIDTLGLDFSEFSDEDFDDYLLGKKTRFENAKAEAEAEAIRIENERLAEIERQKAIEAENAKLKAEAEEKEKALEKERAEALAKQKAIQAEADKKALEEKAKQDAILKAEQDAKAKLEAELQAKKDAEIKAENERLAKEKADKLEADKLAKAPIKKQLSVWVECFEIPYATSDVLSNDVAKEIKEKFEAFKKWSQTQINNL